MTSGCTREEVLDETVGGRQDQVAEAATELRASRVIELFCEVLIGGCRACVSSEGSVLRQSRESNQGGPPFGRREELRLCSFICSEYEQSFLVGHRQHGPIDLRQFAINLPSSRRPRGPPATRNEHANVASVAKASEELLRRG